MINTILMVINLSMFSLVVSAAASIVLYSIRCVVEDKTPSTKTIVVKLLKRNLLVNFMPFTLMCIALLYNQNKDFASAGFEYFAISFGKAMILIFLLANIYIPIKEIQLYFSDNKELIKAKYATM